MHVDGAISRICYSHCQVVDIIKAHPAGSTLFLEPVLLAALLMGKEADARTVIGDQREFAAQTTTPKEARHPISKGKGRSRIPQGIVLYGFLPSSEQTTLSRDNFCSSSNARKILTEAVLSLTFQKHISIHIYATFVACNDHQKTSSTSKTVTRLLVQRFYDLADLLKGLYAGIISSL